MGDKLGLRPYLKLYETELGGEVASPIALVPWNALKTVSYIPLCPKPI